MKRLSKLTICAAILVLGGLALAQSAPPALKAPAVAIDAVPGPVLQAVAPTQGRSTCAVSMCPPGDQACLQGAFDTVLECLRAGDVGSLLPDCEGCVVPGGRAQIFRAHGGGVVLYGTIGSKIRNERLLRSLAQSIERPLRLPSE